MGQMRVMGLSGDDKYIWDADDPASVKEAQTKFDNFKKKGYKIWGIKGQGKGEPMEHFDKFAEKMIVVPPMAGG